MAFPFKLPFLNKKKDNEEEAIARELNEDFQSRFQIDQNNLNLKMPSLPDLDNITAIDVRYPLISPYAFAHIYWNAEIKELVYDIEEPVMSEIEHELLRLVQIALEEMINISFIKATKQNLVMIYLERNVQSILSELGATVSEDTYKKIMYYIYRDAIGLNEIEPFMSDYFIEDIECNGNEFPLFIVHRKYGNMRTNLTYDSKQKLTDFIEKIAQRTGRYVSYAKPLLDGSLPDGSRVNATYTDDVTTRGPTFTIRKFTKDPWTPIHLMDHGSLSAEGYALLWVAVENKLNIMMVGETSSGKTTFLNSILFFIPPEARVTSIEDTRELNLYHDNWLPGVTRTGFGIPNLIGKSYGEITLFDLLRESFRQNPDYVILGETRGKETYVLFQGMASGHPSYATFHAGSVETLVRRLSTPPINLPPSLIESLDLICVVSHVKDVHKNMRRLKEIREILEVSDDGRVKSNQIIQWIPTTDRHVYNPGSRIIEKISNKRGITQESIQNEIIVRAQLLLKIKEKNIYEFKEVAKIINSYYKDKEATLKAFDIDPKTIDLIRVSIQNKSVDQTIKTFNIKDAAETESNQQNKQIQDTKMSPQIASQMSPQINAQVSPQNSQMDSQNASSVQKFSVVPNNQNQNSGIQTLKIEIPKMKSENPSIMSKIESLKSKQDDIRGKLDRSIVENSKNKVNAKEINAQNISKKQVISKAQVADAKMNTSKINASKNKNTKAKLKSANKSRLVKRKIIAR